MKKTLVFALLLMLALSNGCRKQQEDTLDEYEGPSDIGQGTNIEQVEESEKPTASSVAKNLPYNFGKIRPGEYAIVAGRFKSAEKAIAFSRKLRRERINNYIYQQSENSFLVLIGHFVTQAQAEKRLNYLRQKGMGKLELFSAK